MKQRQHKRRLNVDRRGDVRRQWAATIVINGVEKPLFRSGSEMPMRAVLPIFSGRWLP